MNIKVVNEMHYDYKYEVDSLRVVLTCYAFGVWWNFYGTTEEEAWENGYELLSRMYEEEDID